MKNKNTTLSEQFQSTALSHIYMTSHFSGLLHALIWNMARSN